MFTDSKPQQWIVNITYSIGPMVDFRCANFAGLAWGSGGECVDIIAPEWHIVHAQNGPASIPRLQHGSTVTAFLPSRTAKTVGGGL